MGKFRLNSRIKPRIYVRRSTMYNKSSILLADKILKISHTALNAELLSHCLHVTEGVLIWQNNFQFPVVISF